MMSMFQEIGLFRRFMDTRSIIIIISQINLSAGLDDALLLLLVSSIILWDIVIHSRKRDGGTIS